MMYLRQHLWLENEVQTCTMFCTMYILYKRQKAAILHVQKVQPFFRRLYIVHDWRAGEFCVIDLLDIFTHNNFATGIAFAWSLPVPA
jgi:hypothetical protein